MLGCLNSLGSQRKGSLGDWFRGLTQDKLPIAPLIGSLRVSNSLRDVCLWGKRREERRRAEGKWYSCSPEGEQAPWVLCIRLLSFSCRNLRRGLKGGFSRIVISCPGMLSGWWFPLIGQCRAWGSLMIAACPGITSWFCCFSGPGAEIQQRPGCYFQEDELLYLAVNWSANLFSYLSQLSDSTSQRIFLASHYPASLNTTELPTYNVKDDNCYLMVCFTTTKTNKNSLKTWKQLFLPPLVYRCLT